MAKINLNKFTGMFNNENFELEGFELEFAPDEIPAIMKSVMPLINIMKDAAQQSNTHEWDKLCTELNEANEKLHEVERDNESLKSKIEYYNKRREEEKIKKEKTLFKKSLMDAGVSEKEIDLILNEEYNNYR